MLPTGTNRQAMVRGACSVVAALLVLASCSCSLWPWGGEREAQPVSQSQPPFDGAVLTREALDRSLVLGRQYLLSSQRPEGNFVYEYDFVQRRHIRDDNDVRQAGALWGLALLHHDNPSEDTAQAIVKGLEFFKERSQLTPGGRRYIVYPGSAIGNTGTVALVALTLVDFLRADWAVPSAEDYKADLAEYIGFVVSLRMADGHFHRQYQLTDGQGMGGASPYSDGEALLLMVKAAKYSGHTGLKRLTLQSAEQMYRNNIQGALERNPDSDTTKGFYQWGSMAYYELYTSGWPGVDEFAGRVIYMAYWMIDVHKMLSRRRSTGYAHEGLAVAWELARRTGREEAAEKIGRAIDAGLAKLIAWQVGGPMPNKYLKKHGTTDALAVGGVMNAADDPVLRIDVTQHQMHATILARRFLYRP